MPTINSPQEKFESEDKIIFKLLLKHDSKAGYSQIDLADDIRTAVENNLASHIGCFLVNNLRYTSKDQIIHKLIDIEYLYGKIKSDSDFDIVAKISFSLDQKNNVVLVASIKSDCDSTIAHEILAKLAAVCYFHALKTPDIFLQNRVPVSGGNSIFLQKFNLEIAQMAPNLNPPGSAMPTAATLSATQNETDNSMLDIYSRSPRVVTLLAR